MTDRREVERHVWWKHPPRAGEQDEDLEWGYLIFFDNGEFEFLDERPPWLEIANRTSCF